MEKVSEMVYKLLKEMGFDKEHPSYLEAWHWLWMVKKIRIEFNSVNDDHVQVFIISNDPNIKSSWIYDNYHPNYQYDFKNLDDALENAIKLIFKPQVNGYYVF